jgi:hypothetical protein
MGIRAALTSVYMAWLTKSNLKKVRDPAKVAKRHCTRVLALRVSARGRYAASTFLLGGKSIRRKRPPVGKGNDR